MKKILFIIIGMVLGWAQGVQAQQAKLCFVNMPDSLCPLFTSVNRADFVDFLESQMKAVVTNRLGGKSEMTELTSDYLSIQTTPQSTWQLKVLPVNDSTQVICTVSTVGAPVCDSHIRFYTPLWKELPAADYLPAEPLQKGDFLQAASDTTDVYQYEKLVRKADLNFVKASLQGKERTLTFQWTTPEYLEKEIAQQIKPFLREPMVYIWHDGKFVRKH